MPRFKIGFLQKSTGRTVHFRRNLQNCRILDFVGKFFEFSHKSRTSGIFLQKVPNSLGKHQTSTVRTVLFGGLAAKVPYVRYFLAVLRKKVPCVRYFLEPKKWPKSVLFLQIRLFPGKIAPSIAFFQFHRPRKNAKCPKNNRNCVPVFQSGSHLSGATHISLCFLPHCCVNIGREVRLMLPNTYQEIYDTHTCLNFSKTCQDVYIRNIKKPV